ncbi:ParB N-terminal domain-containing protein [Idiomarina abyssalis]|uniref:ParB/RepB/Spo0J family partition protein n=1 Tax=Idiomarina abyssalis TaxID=86102 RepID=UPI003A90E22F
MPIESQTTLLDRSQILTTAERLREETDTNHANGLADLIQSQDLLHPIVVHRDTGELIAGAHRLAAWDILQFLKRPCRRPEYDNWLSIPVRLAYDVSEQDLLALELSENLASKKMSWKEVARAVARIHEFESQDSDQTRAQTAKLLRMTSTVVGNNLRAAFYLAEGEPLVHAATSLTGAMNVISRLEERQLDDLKESLREGLQPEGGTSIEQFNEQYMTDVSLDSPANTAGPTYQPDSPPESSDFQAVNADFIEWAGQYSGPRFNLIHADLPYGIDYDKSGFDYAKHHNIYGDSKDLYFALLAALCDNSSSLVAESAHLIFWYNTRYYNETVSMLAAAGWKVWPHHLIWHKSDNAGVLADPKRGPRHTHETALFASRGDRKIVKPVADSFSAPTTRESGHVSEKPQAVLSHFFNLTVDSSTRILDPTAGSFNSILAAQSRGASSGVGVELDTGYTRRGRRAIAQITTALKNSAADSTLESGTPTPDLSGLLK